MTSPAPQPDSPSDATNPDKAHTLPEGAQLALDWLIDRSTRRQSGPLVVLTSGDQHDESRWTILAEPVRAVEGLVPPGLDRPLIAADVQTPSGLPFKGGWVGLLSSELGEQLEPTLAGHQLQDGPGPGRDHAGPNHPTLLPRGLWLECPSALLIDRDGTCHRVGPNPPARPSPPASAEQAYSCSPLVSLTGRSRYEQGVRRALGAIEAGDVYQVNLTHQLEGVFAGSARGLFAGLVRAARPWFGAYVELEGHAIASASPELFLRVDRQGLVTTRPMKGTRRDAHDLPELVVSEKERAELTMIVDLMRNDLGRVCTPGSVRPVGPRTIERHAGGGIYQATAQVQGRLAPGITLAQLLQATFPPGSVTGAPKLAAIKLARELEPTPRGLYCGAIGLVSNCGAAQFSVAIRTAHLTGPHTRGVFEPGSTLRYGVGAGLVADSVPRREWLETLDKAGVLRAALGHERRAVRAKGLGR